VLVEASVKQVQLYNKLKCRSADSNCRMMHSEYMLLCMYCEMLEGRCKHCGDEGALHIPLSSSLPACCLPFTGLLLLG
jgi:hypothetical protein